MHVPIKFHEDGSMLCPLCDGEYTHVDEVVMAGRSQEDGPVTYTHVGPDGMIKSQSPDTPCPAAHIGEWRRHRIALIGNCELCGGSFSIVFAQHKGQTMLAAVAC